MELQKPDMESYLKVFQYIDKDGSGTIDEQELLEGLKLIGIDLDIDTLRSVTLLVDDDSNKELDFDEFARLCYILDNANPQDIKTILFLAADQDYSGTINFDELKLIFNKMQLELSDEEVKSLYDQITEESHTTDITYKDFITLIGLITQQ